MPGQVGQSDDALRRLAAWVARWRVVEKDLSREIYHAAHDVGVSQRQISEVVGSLHKRLSSGFFAGSPRTRRCWKKHLQR